MTDIELLLELATEAVAYTPDYFRTKWKMDVRLIDLRRRLAVGAPSQLYQALAAVEWVSEPSRATDPGGEWCPWCGYYRHSGHRHDCLRQAAMITAGDGR
jgi:hypothetical protein